MALSLQANNLCTGMSLISISDEKKAYEKLVCQKELLQTITDNLTLGLLMIDNRHHCIFINEAAQKITGYTLAELKAQPFYHFIHAPAGEKRCLPEEWLVSRTLYRKKAAQGEETWIHKDGHSYAVTFTAIPVIKNGIAAGVTVEIKDVTEERKRSKSPGSETEERFRYLADQSPMIMFVTKPDAEAAISFVNKVFLAYIGQTTNQAWSEIVHPDDLQTFFDTYIPAFHQRTAYTTPPIRLKRYDAQYRWHILKGNPRYLPNGAFIGIVGLASDIQEQKQGEQILRQSEERFRNLAETLPQLVWITDAAGKQEFVSKRWQEYTGIQPAEGNLWSVIVHPADLENINRVWSYSLQTGEPYKAEVRLLHQTGDYRWNQVHAEPMLNEDGDIIKWVGAFTDIQEQKKAEEAIRHSEERFRNIANEAPVMLWMTNAAIESVFFNKSWLDFTGIPLEEQLGKPSPVEVHPDDYAGRMNTFLTAFAARKKYECQFRIKRYDGEFRWIRSIGIPRFSEDGKFEGYIGSSIDIHDTMLQQQRKDNFIQMASHELKTPVTTLKAYTQLLLHTTEANKSNTFFTSSLESIDKQVVKVTRLIENILNLTRMERDSLEINRKVFAINDLVKETVADLQKISSNHCIILKENEKVLVLADKDRIEQVFINFITNAVKYSPKANKVIVRIMETPEEVRVSVKDFGIGIAQKDHDKIFDKFYRVEGKNESTYPGFGIGLFLAKEFIKLQGGKIGLNSQPNKGSEFYFTLPVYKPEDKKEAVTKI